MIEYTLLALLAAAGAFYLYRREKAAAAGHPRTEPKPISGGALVRIGFVTVIALLAVVAIITTPSYSKSERSARVLVAFLIPSVLIVFGIFKNIMRNKIINAHDVNRVLSKTNYRPPVTWIDHSRPGAKSWQEQAPGQHFWPTYSTVTMIEQRSTMPQFYLWYYTGDYAPSDQRERGAHGWVQTIDGNHRVGAIHKTSPVFIQLVDWPSEREWKRGARTWLQLYQTTSEFADRLPGGPIRDDDFLLSRYPSGEQVKRTLTLGGRGGRFQNAPPTTNYAHGTAKPLGLTNPEQSFPGGGHRPPVN